MLEFLLLLGAPGPTNAFLATFRAAKGFGVSLGHLFGVEPAPPT